MRLTTITAEPTNLFQPWQQRRVQGLACVHTGREERILQDRVFILRRLERGRGAHARFDRRALSPLPRETGLLSARLQYRRPGGGNAARAAAQPRFAAMYILYYMPQHIYKRIVIYKHTYMNTDTRTSKNNTVSRTCIFFQISFQ